MNSSVISPVSPQVLEPVLRDLVRLSGLDIRFAWNLHPAGSVPELTATFEGPDLPMLLHRHAELLLALEHLATQALRLEPHQHDLISFDAGNFKAQRDRDLQLSAQRAHQTVQITGKAFHFPAMTSRERRLLHLALAPTGLPTASEGEGPQRHLVLHPKL